MNFHGKIVSTEQMRCGVFSEWNIVAFDGHVAQYKNDLNSFQLTPLRNTNLNLHRVKSAELDSKLKTAKSFMRKL